MEDIQITVNGKVLEYYYSTLQNVDKKEMSRILSEIEDTLQFELSNIRALKQQLDDTQPKQKWFVTDWIGPKFNDKPDWI